MYQHYILLHSNYSSGQRIAYHRSEKSIDGLSSFMDIMNSLKTKYPQMSLGFHHVQTDSKDWSSVKTYDMFFKDVFPVNELDTFTKLILDDDQVSAVDIANLIIAKSKCTHLKLQKLLFFFYSNYIKKYNTPPFPEKFLAWDYGPVVNEVYQQFKVYGRNNIVNEEDNNVPIIKEEPFKLSVYSRFKKTSDYGKILESINEVLLDYGHKSANELVDITHEKNSPWDNVYQDGIGKNKEIILE